MKNEPAPRVLAADDDAGVRHALRMAFTAEGWSVHTEADPDGALRAISRAEFDVALIDMNFARGSTEGREGLDLLRAVVAMREAPPVVAMTAWGSVDLAVEAMRNGARDFVQKPWENARLITTLAAQIDAARARRMGVLLATRDAIERAGAADVVAVSPAMRSVREVAERVAATDASVLITGENGTGKGMIARMLHNASARAAGPMITVNMGGLSEGLFESELFGHVRGAFTDARSDRAGRFELAEGGTLFLDEIGNIPLPLQAVLLRVLENGEFERVGSSRTQRANVRVVAATNADVAAEVAAGRFRADLLYRLNTITLHVPPLRDRREDIPRLAEMFFARHVAHYRRPLVEIAEDAMRAMLAYRWPGNVRELSHALERGVLLAAGDRLRAPDLALPAPHEYAGPAVACTAQTDSMSIEEMEAALIRRAVEQYQGNITHAASALGLSRGALYRRMSKYGL